MWAAVYARVSRARRLETVGKQCEAAGVACRLALGTVGFFPAVHASLATLVPMASDHNRPYAYAGFDPNVFYGSVAHLVLAAAGTATCAATFACAARGCVAERGSPGASRAANV